MKSEAGALQELSWIIWNDTGADVNKSLEAARKVWAYFSWLQEQGIQLEKRVSDRQPTE